MAQMLIRNLSDQAVDHIKQRARNAGRSAEAEARDILEREARAAKAEWWRKVSEIRKLTEGKITDDSTDLIREDRDSR
ncbi:MAG: hypothetical protein IT546_16530 [Caulobacteraceae bacterium]|nr:hypothetical protein [Caulobacteraceae bacterium]